MNRKPHDTPLNQSINLQNSSSLTNVNYYPLPALQLILSYQLSLSFQSFCSLRVHSDPSSPHPIVTSPELPIPHLPELVHLLLTFLILFTSFGNLFSLKFLNNIFPQSSFIPFSSTILLPDSKNNLFLLYFSLISSYLFYSRYSCASLFFSSPP